MKKILTFLLAAIAMIPIAGCGNDKTPEPEPSDDPSVDPTPEIIPNQEEVDELKALLVKQDLSPFYERMFASFFKQEYTSYSSAYEDETESIDFFRYVGTGAYGFFYSVEEEQYDEIMAKDNHNLFDFLVKSVSDYEMLQSAYINSYSYEGEDGEGTGEEEKIDIYYSQHLHSLFNNNNLQVSNQLSYEDRLNEKDNVERSFNGLIDLDSLTSTISTSFLMNLFQRATLFDGQRNTEFLDGLYYDICKDLLTKNDKEISDFIITNGVVIEDGEEYTEVHFKIEDDSIKEILANNDIIPGNLKGTLYYDKDTGSFELYEYQIIYMNSDVSDDGFSVHAATMNFQATGYSRHKTYEEIPWITPNPVVYDDASQYITDLVGEVIPPVR